ncbi:trimethylamine methyltransferase family protein [Candidatus Bipolaricaulota bacterium]|nr:trimethylamine methyltransferase family protein [Candidatus Bipolaricaulota bacterium]
MNYAGLIGNKLKLLQEEEVEQIHETALEILEEVGIKVDSERYLDTLHDGGAEIDREEARVKLSERTVKKYLEMAPAEVNLYGRKNEYNLNLKDRKVHYGTGGAAVNILDLGASETRPPTLEDQARLARLVEGLENVHFFQAPVVPTDVPEEDMSLNSFYASMTGTYKNVQESVTRPEKVDEIVEMASIIAGSKEELLDRPFISFVTSWMISPLKLDIGTTEVLERVTQCQIPVALSSAPVTGSTSPASLAGLLVQVHAEELFGIVLAQIFNEGSPVLYGPVPAAANMRNMAYLAGAPETGMMNVGAVQLADYIDVPIYSDGGETDSKVPDTQAGIEGAFNILQVGLAGGNYIHHAAGMMESMLSVAYEKFVIDNDVIGMATRVLRGIDVSDESLALDVIKDVGPGNNFLTEEHTIKNSRSEEFYQPKVIDREDRNTWKENGARETRERSRERAREILKDSQNNLLSENVDRKIRQRFNIHLSEPGK